VESTGPGDLPIRHTVDSDVRRDDVAALDRTAEMIDVLDDTFGPFPFATYGVTPGPRPVGTIDGL
jgi:hypothetical protein